MGKKLKIWLVAVIIGLLGWYSGTFVMPLILTISVGWVIAGLIIAYGLGTLFLIWVITKVLNI